MNKILLIENDRDVFYEIKQFLEEEQLFSVIPADYDEMGKAFDPDYRGITIWNYIPRLIHENADEICVIICDILLHGYASGLDLIKKIRTDTKYYVYPDHLFNLIIPIIAYTGFSDKEVEALRMEANASFQKSKDPAERLKFMETIKQLAAQYDRVKSAWNEYMWPNGLKEKIKDFKKSHIKKNAFLMTSFSDKYSEDIDRFVLSLNQLGGVECHIANAPGGKNTDNLFPNVEVFMHGCDFGIAILFDDKDAPSEYKINPNVSLEIGYMYANKKPILILKENTLKKEDINVDLIGRLYYEFDRSELGGDGLIKRVKEWLNNRKLLQ